MILMASIIHVTPLLFSSLGYMCIFVYFRIPYSYDLYFVYYFQNHPSLYMQYLIYKREM